MITVFSNIGKGFVLLILITSLFLLLLLTGCSSTPRGFPGDIDFRQEMRFLVQELGEYARLRDPDFLLVPQNGQELLTINGEADGPVASEYVRAINGVGREDLYYGSTDDDRSTPATDTRYMEEFLFRALDLGLTVLVTDYVSTPAKVDNSYSLNDGNGFVSFAADRRELDSIPVYPATPPHSGPHPVDSLGDVQNFLYFINPPLENEADFVTVLAETNYDLFIIDLFDENGKPLTAQQVGLLKARSGGRLVLAYLSIGEAEDYRFYWDEEFDSHLPQWLEEENPDWEGNFRVRYWEAGWKSLLFGNENAYLDRILAAGFDGVYLDIIDAFEYFEDLVKPSF